MSRIELSPEAMQARKVEAEKALAAGQNTIVLDTKEAIAIFDNWLKLYEQNIELGEEVESLMPYVDQVDDIRRVLRHLLKLN